MHVVLERTGGFGGMRQRLELEPGLLRFSDRFTGEAERALTPDESAALQRLVARATETTIPPVSSSPGPDTFELRLYVGNGEQPVLTVHTVEEPLQTAPPGPWGELIVFTDALLCRELGARPVH